MTTPVFPNGVIPWTDKVDLQDNIMAADINGAYAEIKSVEEYLINTQGSALQEAVTGIIPLPSNALSGVFDLTVCGRMDINNKSVGAIRVKSVGENLFDIRQGIAGVGYLDASGILTSQSSITISEQTENSITYVATGGSRRGVLFRHYMSVEEGQIYTLYHTRVVTTGDGQRYNVAVCYDKDKQYISHTYIQYGLNYNILTGQVTIPVGVKYVRLYIATYQSTVKDFNIAFVKGTTVVYKPYLESTAYVATKLKSLPNNSSARDEFNILTGEYIKRISEWFILDGSLAWGNATDKTGFKIAYVPQSIFFGIKPNSGDLLVVKYNNTTLTSLAYPTDGFNSSDMTGTGSTGVSISVSDTETGFPDVYTPTSQEWKAYFYGWRMCNSDGTTPYTGTGTKYWKKLTDGTGLTNTIPTVSYSEYTPHKMTYQLSNLVLERLPPQPLTCLPNGTMCIEPIICEQKKYSASGITVSDASFPIKYIESIWRVSGDAETLVDLSNVLYVSGTTSFTITGAATGDVYRYVYEYPSELTVLPTLKYSYPLNFSASYEQLLKAQNNLSQELGSLWFTMLPLADKELRMFMLSNIATPSSATATDCANKINEMLNIWKG